MIADRKTHTDTLITILRSPIGGGVTNLGLVSRVGRTPDARFAVVFIRVERVQPCSDVVLYRYPFTQHSYRTILLSLEPLHVKYTKSLLEYNDLSKLDAEKIKADHFKPPVFVFCRLRVCEFRVCILGLLYFADRFSVSCFW